VTDTLGRVLILGEHVPRRVQRAAYRRTGRALGTPDTPLLLSVVRRCLDAR